MLDVTREPSADGRLDRVRRAFADPDVRRRAAIAAISLALAFTVLLGALGLRHAVEQREAAVRAARSGTLVANRAGVRGVAAAVAEPPPAPLDPSILAPISRDDAILDNAHVPVVDGPLPPARPLVFAGTAMDRVAARTCLAAAVLYEAGDDREGEEAVAQVILNRVRHPAFPKTVCGVVLQGSQRADGSGGCQFTFTCDGALDRAPLLPAWQRAEKIADAALSGSVFKAVGTATHYHAAYVVPYWRESLDKVAVVGLHIFYRWKGWWGTPPAFAGRLQPLEQLDPRMVALAGPGQVAMPTDVAGLVVDPDGGTATPPPPRRTISVPGVSAAELNGAVVRLMDGDAGQFVVQFDSEAAPDSYAMAAARLCGKRADCLVFGWTSEAQMPRSLPLMPIGMRGMSFMYRKSSLIGGARPFWNCRRVHRKDEGECIPGTE